jgi:hypothetical protein
MGVIKVEEIMGYFVGRECVCCDCATKAEEEDASQNEIITLDDVENGDNHYFCDRCTEQIG